MTFQHCIFDLYGTLVDIHTDESPFALWQETARFYAQHGAHYHPDELRYNYHQLVEQEKKSGHALRNDAHEAHPEVQIEKVFLRLFQLKGVWADMELATRAGQHFRRHSTEYLHLYDGAKELLQALRDNGQKVWLLSNAQKIFTLWELESYGLLGLFDGVYISSEYGVKKPDSAFFRILLEEQKIDPATAVMVGNDGICDIQGAKNVGLKTVYIRSNISPKEPLPNADYVLEAMDLYRVKDILTNA